MRLVDRDAEVEEARLFGTEGQSQGGIDFFARTAGGGFGVYQCRRVKRMGPQQIARAVDDFVNGPWFDAADTFGICTTTNLSSARRSEEVLAQRARLEEKGKNLETLDAEKLFVLLKDDPTLVDDFFDRAWVKAFNGDEAASLLVHRLDRTGQAATRRDLAAFYQEVFTINDGGLALAPLGQDAPDDLRDLFVEPDLVEEVESHFLAPDDGVQNDRPDEQDRANLKGAVGRGKAGPSVAQVRIKAEAWIRTQTRAIISGNPGSGKSSLLRFLALDLLSDEPRFAALARSWNAPIPLWIPFGRWTELIGDGEDRSLESLLRRWLQDFGRDGLAPLYEDALRDGRAVLLIDGLDEWTSRTSAGLAFNILRVRVSEGSLRAIATTRPHALQDAGLSAQDWTPVGIAGLERGQQLSVIERLTKWSRESRQAVAVKPSSFIDELLATIDLRELAAVPLTLVLLYWIRARGARLPRDRFQAYDDLLDLFLAQHPARRSAAATMKDDGPPLDDRLYRFAVGALAFAAHEEGGRDLTIDGAVEAVAAHLSDQETGLGMDRPKAIELGHKIIGDVTERLGLLLETGRQRYAFLHRSIQEHLGGIHLSRLPISEQLKFVSEHASEPRWQEVLLSLIYLTTRPSEVDELVECLRRSRCEAGWTEGDPLMAEIAVGSFGCRTALAKELADEAARECETFARPSVAVAIATRLVERVDAQPDELEIGARVRSWLSPQPWSREGLFAGMADWPANPHTDRALIRALFSDEARDSRAAAFAYGRRQQRVSGKPAFLTESLARPLPETTRASVLEALSGFWPDHAETLRGLEAAERSESPTLRFIAHRAAVQHGKTEVSRFADLISMAREDGGLGDEWEGELFSTLVYGWQRDPRFKAVCLSEVGRSRGEGSFRYGLAESLLIQAFPEDPDVLNFCVNQLGREEFPFLAHGHAAWRAMAFNFPDSPELIAALDQWLSKDDHHAPEASFAARVGWTDVAKQRLIRDLRGSWVPFWAARALLDGWGMADRETRSVLLEAALGEADQAASIGHFLPEILGTGSRCSKRLLELLTTPEIKRMDLILEGIAHLDDRASASKAADLALDRLLSGSMGFDSLGQIVELDPMAPRVRTAAIASLADRRPPFYALSKRYGKDEEIGPLLRDFAAPLDPRTRVRCWKQLLSLGAREDTAEIAGRYPAEANPMAGTVMAQVHARSAVDATRQEHALSIGVAELRTGDPNWEAHAQAGLMALIELGRLDAFAPITFVGSRKPKPFSVPLNDHRRSNIELATALVDNWPQVKAALGEDFADRFVGISGSADESFWDVIAAVGDRRPETEEDVRAQILDGTHRLSVSRLGFLARTQGKSAALREACLQSIAGVSHDQNAMQYASELLAEHFGGDGDVGDLLLRAFRSEPTPPRLAAICEGWPGALADQALEFARRQDLRAPFEYVWQVQIAAGDTSSAFESLEAFIKMGWERFPWLKRVPLRGIIRRIGEDEELADKLRHRLLGEDARPSESASFVRLLGLAAGFESAEQAQLLAQMNSPRGLEIGVDLVAGSRRPVAHAIADALEPA